jgi:hypothetical protein
MVTMRESCRTTNEAILRYAKIGLTNTINQPEASSKNALLNAATINIIFKAPLIGTNKRRCINATRKMPMAKR